MPSYTMQVVSRIHSLPPFKDAFTSLSGSAIYLALGTQENGG